MTYPTPRHGGNLRQASQTSGLPEDALLDFSASINPLGPPPWLEELIRSQIKKLKHYPDPRAEELVCALAKQHNIDGNQIIVGNGASELLYLLPRVLQCRRLLVAAPSYGDYTAMGQAAGLEIDLLPSSADENFQLNLEQLAAQLTHEHLTVIGHPNNPTGNLCDREALQTLARQHPKNHFIIDESFIDFCDPGKSLRQSRPANITIVQSMTKFWAIPGLRLGYALTDHDVVTAMNDIRPDWTVNCIAQAIGTRALEDQEFPDRTRHYVVRQRTDLLRQLSEIDGLHPFPSAANFILVRIDHPSENVTSLARKLLKKGIVIRNCCNFHRLKERYFRVAVRTDEEQKCLCAELRACLTTDSSSQTGAPSTKTEEHNRTTRID